MGLKKQIIGKKKPMNYKEFIDEMFKDKNAFREIQPIYCGKEKVAATCLEINSGKVIAVWIPRKGIVWQR